MSIAPESLNGLDTLGEIVLLISITDGNVIVVGVRLLPLP
ncbi:hypothetical protein HIPEINDE_01656 [Mannheimia haemolytica]